MKFFVAAFAFSFSVVLAIAQDATVPTNNPTSVTIPATIDHNRIVISVSIPLSDGSSLNTRAWINNGSPDLYLSRRLATQLGLSVKCDDHECLSPPPSAIRIGDKTISLPDVKEAKIPLRPVTAAAVLVPGMNVEITLPATVLRHYDVLINFPDHKFSIGNPGSLHFLGTSGKVRINADNGLITLPSQIEKKKFGLALDLGSGISFLSDALFGQLNSAHANWPQMTGAVGSANITGTNEEKNWRVMRIDRVQFGPLFLANVSVVDLPQPALDTLDKRAGVPTAGLIGSNALMNYRVGLDYAHSAIYFDFGRNFQFPDFDVVGLILRPEDDGQFTILGVADFNGKPSATDGAIQVGDHLVAVNDIPMTGSTMGQVWGALGGTPGQQRKLTIERSGKQFIVTATVQHFLAELPDDDKIKRYSPY